jgi:hypothetical protein
MEGDMVRQESTGLFVTGEDLAGIEAEVILSRPSPALAASTDRFF